MTDLPHTIPNDCPFCGSPDTALGAKFDPFFFIYYVMCRHCGAEGPHSGRQAQSEEAAIAAWNRRGERNA